MTLREKYSVMPPGLSRRTTEASSATKAARALFGLLGLGAGIAAGIYTANENGSIWLSIFVAGAALFIVGRALPDVLTMGKKFRRTLYFLLYPALAVGILYLAYQAWEKWWLAVVLAWVVGLILNLILVSRLFPDIFREERAEDVNRMRHMGG